MPVTRNQSNAAANAKANIATVDSGGTSSERGETSTETEPSRRDSPDNCSICLGPFSNKSFTSSCAHSFCFICLKQWSKVKAECPLCKQPFTSIFHNIRSNDSYDIYELPPLNPPRPMDYSYMFNWGGIGPSHHYLSLTHPSLDADLTLSNFSRFQFRNRRSDRYFSLLHPVHGEHQYSYSSSTFNPSTHVSAATWPRGAEDFRLRVYRHHMGPPAVILGCENSTYRLTPAMVAASGHRWQRIQPWLKRELQVILRNEQSVRMAISVIQPLLSMVTVDSIYFSDRVSPLIGHRSRQFINEFVAFTNSALQMQAFDRKAMYRRHDSEVRILDTSSSSDADDDDDVVEVTDVSPEVSSTAAFPSSSVASTSLQRSGWDSPTPGPSWGNSEVRFSAPVEVDRLSISSESDAVFRPDANVSDSDTSKAGSDIVFLKYDKPWNERSPIRLSSDSDGEGQSKKKKKAKHKKKRKDVAETQAKSSKKEKRHKASRSKSRDKSRSQRASCEVVAEPESSSVYKLAPAELPELSLSHKNAQAEPSSTTKRRHSLSDRQKKKKHKRHKERGDEQEERDRDRELVDRLFAQALTQQQNLRVCDDTDDDEDGANLTSVRRSKSKDKNANKSSDKDRHKRKKKKSQNKIPPAGPSLLQSYKKHHSGHKKSSGKNLGPESERRRHHQHRRTSRDNSLAEFSGRQAVDRDQSIPRPPILPPTNVGHSVASTFQTSYLARADTVQHIPLNLWVSAWSPLAVSHTFPPPPSSPGFSSSVPQTSSSILSNSDVNQSSSDHNSSAVNSHTISSSSGESTSDCDSEESSDEPSRPGPNSSRTKQWLDSNFSSRRQPGTSAAPTVARPWDMGSVSIVNNDNLDVVSVGSGEEDIVVCSSDSSSDSDTVDVSIIEDSDGATEKPSTSHVEHSKEEADHKSHVVSTEDRQHFDHSGLEGRVASGSQSNKVPICSPTSSIFQPFRLHKKKIMAKKNKNPFFSSTAQYSDEDDDDALFPSNHQLADQKIPFTQALVLSSVSSSATNATTDIVASSSIAKSEADYHAQISTAPTTALPTPLDIPTSLNTTFSISQISDGSSISSSIAVNRTSSESLYSMLPPPFQSSIPSASSASVLHSGISYLPYTPLPVPGLQPALPFVVPPTVAPPTLPFVVPPTSAPPTLPLHFPFAPMSSLVPTVLPPVYISYSQTTTTLSDQPRFPTNEPHSVCLRSSSSEVTGSYPSPLFQPAPLTSTLAVSESVPSEPTDVRSQGIPSVTPDFTSSLQHRTEAADHVHNSDSPHMRVSNVYSMQSSADTENEPQAEHSLVDYLASTDSETSSDKTQDLSEGQSSVLDGSSIQQDRNDLVQDSGL